jgi:hypothetical protein
VPDDVPDADVQAPEANESDTDATEVSDGERPAPSPALSAYATAFTSATAFPPAVTPCP